MQKGKIFFKQYFESCAFYGLDTEPELVKSRNRKRNFSEVGTGSVKIVTVPQHWSQVQRAAGAHPHAHALDAGAQQVCVYVRRIKNKVADQSNSDGGLTAAGSGWLGFDPWGKTSPTYC